MSERVQTTPVEIDQHDETLEVILFDSGVTVLHHLLEAGSGAPPRQNRRYQTLALHPHEAEALGLALIGAAALSRAQTDAVIAGLAG